MSKIKAVVFDMDGVLIDAKDWHFEALNRALGNFGFTISRYDHFVTYDGLPTKKKLEILSLERGLPKGLHEFINELKQIYTTELIHARCKPLFQHEYALSQLKQMGYRLAVASNSIRSTVELMMEKSNLKQYLSVILSNQQITHPKPHPEIYLKAFQTLGVAPEQALVIEDNKYGIRAAEDSGAKVMAVKTTTDVTLSNIVQKIKRLEGR